MPVMNIKRDIDVTSGGGQAPYRRATVLFVALLCVASVLNAGEETTREYEYDSLGNRTSATNQVRFTSTSAFTFQPKVVLSGDRLNIYGRNFPAGDATDITVTFNDVEAEIISVAPRVVTLIVPDEVSSGEVVITLPDGTEVELGSLFVQV